jgi:hypothetical protein
VQQDGAADKVSRRPDRLLVQGFVALALSAVFIAPALVLDTLEPLRTALRFLLIPGFLLALIGTVLLVSHLIVRRRAIRAWAHTHLAPRFPVGDWDSELLQGLAPAQFEALCVAFFQQAGFEVRSRQRSEDGALDLRLYARAPEAPHQPLALVRCKYLGAGRVGLPEMLHYYGVLAAHTLKRGTYATNAGFSDEAMRFAAQHGIRTVDGDELLAQIARRSPQQRQALLDRVLG